MPALEVLNLSRTRIRCLPESISQLVSLKRLFLNDCVLLRSISPAIGRLKQLEVFDLEGTKIKNLPKEIECLINMTCLGFSISGTEPSNDSKTVIPHGVISSLLHLEELNLDVNADAEWWDTCAEGVVSEVCNLKRLSTFKFSFPTMELLRQFNQLRKSMEHPSLAQFRLCVGNHASCIMNRLPLNIEFELERCNRYLRYTNGDDVFTDIKDMLQQLDALFLERHANLKTLSELRINSMEQLKWCVLGECNELEVLIDSSDTMHQEALIESHCKSACLESLEFLYVYYMRNLRNIWKGSVQKGCLSSLKLLTLCKCPELTVIFSCEMLDNLNNLEEVTIEDCPAIKSLISCQNSFCEVLKSSYFLPMLKKLSLHYVPELSSISCGLWIALRLERLSFYNCPSLKSLSTNEVSSEQLKKIRGERSWWKDLEWRGHKPDHLDGIFVPIDTCDVP
ncbi:disease resistance protein At4g27190-like [Eucalyptus grandis]|uniref:disease resistance protein At4g27190-like n=1 Tax=Eucalyptus grandis TaxID=71139 RepID=UPI00192EA99E|nr:disease resistance protein At4g27190-like [Eucalyptus grandis]